MWVHLHLRCYLDRNLERLEKRIFNMYDENRDGRISFAEFMVVMYVLSNGTPEDNLKQIFRIVSGQLNNSGTISSVQRHIRVPFYFCYCFWPIFCFQMMFVQHFGKKTVAGQLLQDLRCRWKWRCDPV